MGKNKVSITEYDKAKAPWYFVGYKLFEIACLWFITFGFYYIGYSLVNFSPSFAEYLIQISWFGPGSITILDYWSFGLTSTATIALILYILISWVKKNWSLAKKKTETKKGKERRDLAQKYLDREKHGFCVGDEATYICKRKYADNKERLDQKCIIGKTKWNCVKIYPLWKDGSKGGRNGDGFINSLSFGFFKHKKLPKLK